MVLRRRTGSDAVSGVVNILLDKRLEGLKLEGDYGVTQRGDGKNYHLGMAAGTSLFEGRGHVIVGVEYQKMESIDDCSAARSWCRESNGYLLNGGSGFELRSRRLACTLHRSLQLSGLNPAWPQRVTVSNLRANQVNQYGVIYNRATGATNAISANAAGTSTDELRDRAVRHRSVRRRALGGDGVPQHGNHFAVPGYRACNGNEPLQLRHQRLHRDLRRGVLRQCRCPSLRRAARDSSRRTVASVPTTPISGTFGAAVLAAASNDRPGAGGGCATDQTVVRKDWLFRRSTADVTTDTGTYRALLGSNGRFGVQLDLEWPTTSTDRPTHADPRRQQHQQAHGHGAGCRHRQPHRFSATFGSLCRVTRDGVQPRTPVPLTRRVWRCAADACR